MLDAIIVAATISTSTPTIELLERPIQETVQVEPPKPTLEEKIKTNYYKCNTDLEWIRADNAECKPKATRNVQSPVRGAYRSSGNSSGNTYTAGNCTWYAKSMRPDLPNNLGNANTWASRALAQGIPVGLVPRAGAVGQLGMHVVYVTGVNPDGTFNLSEMNRRGLYIVSTRSNVSPAGWQFIY